VGAVEVRGYQIRPKAKLPKADLSGVDLSGVDLTKVYLTKANLSGANLSGANLYGAYLNNADLSGADFSGADLTGAFLSKANLSGANLSGANLHKAWLDKADLSGADLSGANFGGARSPEEANFSGAKADNATFWPHDFAPDAHGVIFDAPVTGNEIGPVVDPSGVEAADVITDDGSAEEGIVRQTDETVTEESRGDSVLAELQAQLHGLLHGLLEVKRGPAGHPNDMNMKCADCKKCISGWVQPGPMKTGNFCSLCCHPNFAHKSPRLERHEFSLTPNAARFMFDPSQILGIRGVICLQTSSTSPKFRTKLIQGERYNLLFRHDRFELYGTQRRFKEGVDLTGKSDAAKDLRYYEDLTALEFGGAGAQTSDAGFIGGGFGLAGIAIGVVGSAAVNKLTKRTTIETLIRIEMVCAGGGTAEFIFLTGVASPEDLSVRLRSLTLRLEENTPQATPTVANAEVVSSTPGDVIAQLKELGELRVAGVITDEEFATLKAEILD